MRWPPRPTPAWSTNGCGRSSAKMCSREGGSLDQRPSAAIAAAWAPAFAGAHGGLMRTFFLAAAAVLSTSATAQQPIQPPKLIVAIAVDQFSSDLYDEYRPHFTAGLNRLASGIAFRNGYQSHNATETCPGHSTILTGSHPSPAGIIANVLFR